MRLALARLHQTFCDRVCYPWYRFYRLNHEFPTIRCTMRSLSLSLSLFLHLILFTAWKLSRNILFFPVATWKFCETFYLYLKLHSIVTREKKCKKSTNLPTTKTGIFINSIAFQRQNTKINNIKLNKLNYLPFLWTLGRISVAGIKWDFHKRCNEYRWKSLNLLVAWLFVGNVHWSFCTVSIFEWLKNSFKCWFLCPSRKIFAIKQNLWMKISQIRDHCH